MGQKFISECDVIMKVSLYDLSFNCIKDFYGTIHVPIERKRNVISNIARLLGSGWTANEIMVNLKKYFDQNLKHKMNLTEYFNMAKRNEYNLLEPNRFYYHNQLRITTNPPMIDFDINTGKTVRIIEDYFLEMKASYTIDELTGYFITKPGLYEHDVMQRSRIKGSLNWLLKSIDYNIDLVLFMIDTANDIIVTNNYRKLHMPADIRNYYKEAKELLISKITESKASGGDVVVPKKRMLPDRGRVLA